MRMQGWELSKLSNGPWLIDVVAATGQHDGRILGRPLREAHRIVPITREIEHSADTHRVNDAQCATRQAHDQVSNLRRRPDSRLAASQGAHSVKGVGSEAGVEGDDVRENPWRW